MSTWSSITPKLIILSFFYSVTLPARHTLYWCTMLKLPEMPGKHHMIGYKPKISEDSKRYVHHMMLYECHDEVKWFHEKNERFFVIVKNLPIKYRNISEFRLTNVNIMKFLICVQSIDLKLLQKEKKIICKLVFKNL